jgi:hypothetical protein
MSTKKCNSCHGENHALSVLCAYCGKLLSGQISGNLADNRTSSLVQPSTSFEQLRKEFRNINRSIRGSKSIKHSHGYMADFFEIAKESPFINNNPSYWRSLNQTSLAIDDVTEFGCTQANAFASHFDHWMVPGQYDAVSEISDFPDGTPEGTIHVTGPCIVMNAYLVCIAEIASVFLCSSIPASNVSKERLYDLGKLVLSARSVDQFQIYMQRVALLCDDAQLCQNASRVCDGAIMSVIAHEMGHICLGHVTSFNKPNEIKRNQEREADSFAQSLLLTMENRAYFFVGSIIFQLIYVWNDHGRNHELTTHPDSRDRFHAAFVSNPTAASEAEALFGMSQDDWIGLLP